MKRRTTLVAGNWKMNPPSIAESVALAKAVRDGTRDLAGAEKEAAGPGEAGGPRPPRSGLRPSGGPGLGRAERARVGSQALPPGRPSVEVVVAPPFVALAAVREALAGSHVRLAAQDLHEEERGAHTGGVSAAMLRELVACVIVGHSEVRRDQGLSEARVNARLRRALAAGLVPILCLGEDLAVRRAERADDFVRGQVRADLEGVSPAEASRVVIAYEPIWAIGTGVPATGPGARDTIVAIRSELGVLYGEAAAEGTRVLYGGSVTADNIAEFASQPGIDGALVGGASLRAGEFARIARAFSDERPA